MVKNKQKVLNVFLAVVFIWLVVSIYFYGQHLLVFKQYPVYAKAETEDAILIITQCPDGLDFGNNHSQ